MYLSANVLDLCVDANHFIVVDQVKFTQGDSPFVFIQLKDLSQNSNGRPSGLRYMPAANPSLTITISNTYQAISLVKQCTQPFSNDTSIWKFQVLTADNLNGLYTISLQLLEGTNITNGRVDNALFVYPQSGVLV